MPRWRVDRAEISLEARLGPNMKEIYACSPCAEDQVMGFTAVI